MNFDQSRVLTFLQEHPLMTFTTISNTYIPQSAAMYVFVDGDFSCYCVTKESTRKYGNVKENHTATLSVFDESALVFVEVTGTAELVTDEGQVAQMLPKLQDIVRSRKTSYWVPPVSQVTGEHYAFIKLSPYSVSCVNYDTEAFNTAEPKTFRFDPQVKE